MAKQEIKNIIEKSIKVIQKEKKLANFLVPEIIVEIPREKIRGDYSTGIAFAIAKDAAEDPFKIATEITEKIKSYKSEIFKTVEVVNGFINFRLSENYLQKQISLILRKKSKFGSLNIGKKEKINVEFISANPTGPLTLGNGRGGFCGDVLVNVLAKAGYKVVREYYINDRGEQIIKLGHSVLGDSQAVYKGEYIEELRKKLLGHRVSQWPAEKVGERAAKIILEKIIKPTVKRMGIKFDVWFSEKKIYQNKEVDKIINDLTKKGFTYNSEGAVWFRCKELGDDKDRVLIRSDDLKKTYIASDAAYIKNKFKRGFEKLFVFLGTDHHGYVARFKAITEALGYKKENIEIILMQLVRLFKNGQEVRMAKRAGVYVTLDELLDEVSLDVARFFFLTKSPDTHFNFDMDLAKEQSSNNPVYYVQYAHARICSILKKAKAKNNKPNFDLLKEQSEMELIRQLIRLPEVVEDTAKDYQVQRLPQYAMELADAFHKFYENCRVIGENKACTKSRIALVLATKIVLKNTLDLMGISSPNKM